MATIITPLENYKTEVAPALAKQLGKTNVMAIPRVAKVKVAVGFGKMARKGGSNNMDEEKIRVIVENIAAITGQKPTIHKSKKAISNFKLREDMTIAASVTLRGPAAYDFIAKLVHIVLPRVRDFRGIPARGFDGIGSYSLGLKDHTVFPEIRPEKTDFTHGLQVTVCTTGRNAAETRALLDALHFPFVKPTKK